MKRRISEAKIAKQISFQYNDKRDEILLRNSRLWYNSCCLLLNIVEHLRKLSNYIIFSSEFYVGKYIARHIGMFNIERDAVPVVQTQIVTQFSLMLKAMH